MDSSSLTDEPRVLLVSMPFMSLDLAPVSIGLLQAELRRSGIACDSTFLGFDFADAIGSSNYEILMREGVLLGEWVFAEALNGAPLVDHELAQLEEFNRGWHRWDDGTRQAMTFFRDSATRFIDWAVSARSWDDYDLIGFSSTFHQNLASLALGKRLKAEYPNVKVAFGGSNWQGEMGKALHETFTWIDYAATGEADGIIADIALASVGQQAPEKIPGICFRQGDTSVATAPVAAASDLDHLPVPDYDDWFYERKRSRACVGQSATLVFESSRGCWWGERFHCTFCGLNGENMASRRKSAPQVLAELEAQRARYGIGTFMATDTIIPIAFFRELLPELTQVDPPFDLFYETKANLSAAKVKLMADAGITELQPGIESLSDHVLELIAKGTTGIQNVQLLRWCAEFGVKVDWPILTEVPYETVDDYEAFRTMAEKCTHLPAPGQMQATEIHRFSPLHERSKELGYENVRSNPAYTLLYPGSDELRDRIAYTFIGDRIDRGADEQRPAELIEPIVERWRSGDSGGFWLNGSGDHAAVHDERQGQEQSWQWTGWQARLLHLCDSVRSRGRLGELLVDVEAADLDACLGHFVELGHLLRSGDKYLTLPVYRPARNDLAERRRKPIRLQVQADIADAVH